jgi:hypothetical protein
MKKADIDKALEKINAMTPDEFEKALEEATDAFGSTLEPFLEAWVEQLNSRDEKR